MATVLRNWAGGRRLLVAALLISSAGTTTALGGWHGTMRPQVPRLAFICGMHLGTTTVAQAESTFGPGMPVTGAHPESARVWRLAPQPWLMYIDQEDGAVDVVRLLPSRGSGSPRHWLDAPAARHGPLGGVPMYRLVPGSSRTQVLTRLRSWGVRPMTALPGALVITQARQRLSLGAATHSRWRVTLGFRDQGLESVLAVVEDVPEAVIVPPIGRIAGVLVGVTRLLAVERRMGLGLTVPGAHPLGGRVWHLASERWFLHLDANHAVIDRAELLSAERASVPPAWRRAPRGRLHRWHGDLVRHVGPGMMKGRLAASLRALGVPPERVGAGLVVHQRGKAHLTDGIGDLSRWTATFEFRSGHLSRVLVVADQT